MTVIEKLWFAWFGLFLLADFACNLARNPRFPTFSHAVNR